MAPLEIAMMFCAGAEAGTAVAATIATDTNAGANTRKGAAQTQQAVGAIQNTVGHACPVLVNAANAMQTAASPSAKSGK